MKHEYTYVTLSCGVLEIKRDALDKSHLEYLAQDSVIHQRAALNFHDRSAVHEGTYIPPQHIYFHLDAIEAAHLSAVFSKLSRQLRGLE